MVEQFQQLDKCGFGVFTVYVVNQSANLSETGRSLVVRGRSIHENGRFYGYEGQNGISVHEIGRFYGRSSDLTGVSMKWGQNVDRMKEHKRDTP